jgi:hypothetical protein
MPEADRKQQKPTKRDDPHVWEYTIATARVTYWGMKVGHWVMTIAGIIGGLVVYKVVRDRENIDPQEKAIAAALKPATCPVRKEISDFRRAMREKFEERQFADLETEAHQLRETKALFRNGTWKINEFYEAFSCDRKAPDDQWHKAEGLIEDWIAAKPESLTAHLAYANFLTDYAWHARGSGWAHTISETGGKLLGERLIKSGGMLEKARSLADNDPMWWLIALRVGLGMGWEKQNFDAVVEDAYAFDPQFWHTDTARAYSLLPRWYGEPGDWEAYAAKAADRPGSLGAEAYARMVIEMTPYYSSVFRDAKASWPRAREGLERLRQKYPDAIEFTSYAALLATMAYDRPTAEAMFAELGDTFLPDVWPSKASFVHYQHWAKTGQW